LLPDLSPKAQSNLRQHSIDNHYFIMSNLHLSNLL